MSGQDGVSSEDYAAAAELLAGCLPMPCSYCGVAMVHGDPQRHPTRDHVWPKAVRSISKGRTGKVWCCAKCNHDKADKMPAQWLEELKARGL